jgi:heme A synthase
LTIGCTTLLLLAVVVRVLLAVALTTLLLAVPLLAVPLLTVTLLLAVALVIVWTRHGERVEMNSKVWKREQVPKRR